MVVARPAELQIINISRRLCATRTALGSSMFLKEGDSKGFGAKCRATKPGVTSLTRLGQTRNEDRGVLVNRRLRGCKRTIRVFRVTRKTRADPYDRLDVQNGANSDGH